MIDIIQCTEKSIQELRSIVDKRSVNQFPMVEEVKQMVDSSGYLVLFYLVMLDRASLCRSC